nr:hypothetical protein [Tanacetum cinerariifolium]
VGSSAKGIGTVRKLKRLSDNGSLAVSRQIEERIESDELNVKLSELKGASSTDKEKIDEFDVHFGKYFVPQQEVSDEQAFWLLTSHSNIDQSASSPVKIEAPQELPKITPDALTEGEWGFEHTKAVFLKEIISFLKTLKYIFNVFDKDPLNEVTEVQTVFNQMEAAVQHIKNDLRKFKGNDIVENVAQVLNFTTTAPGIYKPDSVNLAPKDKNNRETHIFYLKKTMEQAVILREIVEQAKSLNPLDSASYSSYKYVKLIQELLGHVRDTFLDIHKPSEKLVVVTPINKKKVVRRPKVPKTNGSNNKTKIAKSVIFNKTKPNTSRRSNTSVAPSSSSLIDL